MGVGRFEDMEVWQHAHQFVLGIYRASEKFPKHEIFGLRGQLRRAAVSIPANLAEGYKKNSKLDKLRYYNIAQGSLEECRYYLILCRDLGYIETPKLDEVLNRVGRMLYSYIQALRADT